jgi:hypothetical protein
MILKKWLCVFTLLGLVLLPLSGATVSFMVIETGVSENSPANASSNLWESGMMDGFFDAGHIVSNAPMLRLEQKPDRKFPEEARQELKDAQEGGADFFVLIFLEYRPSTTGEAQVPGNISLRLFRITPHKILYEARYPGGAGVPPGEQLLHAKNTARMIIPHLRDKG